MIEQLNNSIVFYAFFSESKLGKTGLTVTVDVRNPAGTLVVTAGSAVEVGGGLYKYTLSSASVITEGEYTAVFKTTTTSVDLQHIPALWSVNRAGIEHLTADIPSGAAVSTLVWTEPYVNKNTGNTMGWAMHKLITYIIGTTADQGFS